VFSVDMFYNGILGGRKNLPAIISDPVLGQGFQWIFVWYIRNQLQGLWKGETQLRFSTPSYLEAEIYAHQSTNDYTYNEI